MILLCTLKEFLVTEIMWVKKLFLPCLCRSLRESFNYYVCTQGRERGVFQKANVYEKEGMGDCVNANVHTSIFLI